MNNAIYDKVGMGYNTTRRADPYIAGRLYEMLAPIAGGLYADIGCGTGNYLHALSGKGLTFYGIDPSETMLSEARVKNPDTTFIQAKAESIPVEDHFFDGALACFTLHHWSSMLQGLTEVSRILKPGGTLVILSWTPEQILNYWLNHYFSRMMQASSVAPPLSEMEAILNASGFTLSVTEKYFVQPDLQDHFLYSNKFRPEQYLKPEIRNGASSFTVFAEPEEVEAGLILLEQDIASGKINEVMQQYENDFGDYMFLIAEKQ
jgi:ubiquinone/menaquinone biosynthesis C-methylase UbiE